jgi:PIN domain nuclease of toxin-antitoxin system
VLYVVDTHPLIWYLAEKLPKKVDNIFRDSEDGNGGIFVPTIVLAECYYLSKKKKIQLDFEEILGKVKESSNFLITPFNDHIVELFPKINVEEIHDKIIVSTAKLLNVPLITKDKEIINSRVVRTIW